MTTPLGADESLDERRFEVLVKQGAGLRLQILLTVIIIATIVWSFIPTPVVAVWMVLALAVREWRAAVLSRLLDRSEVAIAKRIRYTVIWNVGIGAANGSAALFIPWLDTTQAALLTMVLVSWGSGGVSTGATIVPAFMAYGVCLFFPTSLMWFLHGGGLGYGVGALVLMFFGVQVRFARRNCDTFEESFEMRRENLELARRLSEEGVALAAARDVAEEANRAKSHFLASASHDLRQPLQALALNSGELTRTTQGSPNEVLAAEISRSIDDLRTMLNGLLDLSSLDSGSVDVRWRNVKLRTLLEGVASSFRAAAQSRGLTLKWSCEPNVTSRTDPDLLRRLLANLIDNAIKFTPHGSVEVRAEVRDDAIFVSVSDTGIGVATSEQQRIFEELVQLGNPERDRNKGYGLGLAIVRRLTTLLGIDLKVRSSPGAGSTFTLRLPSEPDRVDPPATAADEYSPESMHGCRVLVLDDDALVRTAYARLLAGRGCEVAVSANASEALSRVREFLPHVALVDYRLRDSENGLSAIASLRAARPMLVALLCSADISPAISAAASGAGVTVLRKPIDEVTLAREISAARRRHVESAPT